jgi:pantoate--beta-alanine ligase
MVPEVTQSPQAAVRKVRAWHRDGLTVGLVPTMGALHEGHLSLVRTSVAECDRTVVSIYVNPTQFAEGDDLASYPRRLERDCALLGEAGAVLVFGPTDEVMYPPGFCTHICQEGLTERLCGAFRPGHFRGVLSIVLKLLHIVPADRAYFGRKDFQQSVLIRRMVADLNIAVDVRVLPTVREADGLAMSSRNEYLSPGQRRQAVCLYEALTTAREMFSAGESRPGRLIAKMKEVIGRYPDARPQYVEIVAPDSLRAVGEVAEEAVAALAVFVGEVRLIDNMDFGNCPDVLVQEHG